MEFFGNLGAAICMGIAALGSAIGIGIAGQGAIGAWKRCYINNKPAPFILTVFAGAPLTQTIYGYLLMLIKLKDLGATNPGMSLGLGLASGIAMALSAIAQGKVAAASINILAKKPDDWSKGMIMCIVVEFYAILCLLASFLMLNAI